MMLDGVKEWDLFDWCGVVAVTAMVVFIVALMSSNARNNDTSDLTPEAREWVEECAQFRELGDCVWTWRRLHP